MKRAANTSSPADSRAATAPRVGYDSNRQRHYRRSFWRGLILVGPLLIVLMFSVQLPIQPAWATDPAEEFVPPDLSVEIPTLNLSTIPTKSGDPVDIPWIAEYIVGVYKYAVGIAGILAAVMMMIGGLQIMTARGDASAAKAGKDKIQDAVIGVFLTLSVYTILRLVNPDLVVFKKIKIETLPPIEFWSDPTPAKDEAFKIEKDFVTIKNPNVFGGGTSSIPRDMRPAMLKVAQDLESLGYGMFISSGGYRDVATQSELMKIHCNNPPGSKSCGQKNNLRNVCTMAADKDGGPPDPGKCAHTTGRVLDIWAMKKDADGATFVRCIKAASSCYGTEDILQKCFSDPCQSALAAAMRKNGFCQLNNEAWHFELKADNMSAGCR